MAHNVDEIKPYLIDFASRGYTLDEIAQAVSISTMTLVRWRKKFPRLKEQMEVVSQRFHAGLIKRGLRELAAGMDYIEVKDEVLMKDGTKRTTIKRKNPPSIHALKMLASKYLPDDYQETENRELTIRITQQNRALTHEERVKLLERDKLASDTIEDIEWKEV